LTAKANGKKKRRKEEKEEKEKEGIHIHGFPQRFQFTEQKIHNEK
jgi:hypothetical protein